MTPAAPDTIDERIIRELQRNAKQTTGSIARRTRIPTTTVHNRIKRLERDGIITSYVPMLDHTKLGKGILALVFVAAEHKADQEQLAKRLLHIDGVERARIITGEFDLLLEARAATIEELNSIITKELRKVPGVARSETMIVLSEVSARETSRMR
jgi:DNA-binding Lrp family transcriptional regulator